MKTQNGHFIVNYIVGDEMIDMAQCDLGLRKSMRRDDPRVMMVFYVPSMDYVVGQVLSAGGVAVRILRVTDSGNLYAETKEWDRVFCLQCDGSICR